VVLVCQLLLVGVFVWAGVAKLVDPTGTRAGLAAFGVPGAARAAWWLLPASELTVAALVGSVATRRAGGIAALALLAVFTGAALVQIRAGNHAPCNCFGSVRPGRIGVGLVIRNLVLIGLGIVVAVA
jgi:hypothetical protein